MRKTFFGFTLVALLLAAGCTSLNGLLNDGNSLLNMVIGHYKIGQDELLGSWGYSAPGCAFTSEKLLAKAGGAVAAGRIKDKIAPAFNFVGVKASNTYLTFEADGGFSGKLDGLPLRGTYQYNPSTGTLQMNVLLFSATAYITRTTNGLALTFDSSKLLSLIQLASSLTSSGDLHTRGELSKDFDGARVGFELKRQ